MAPVAIDPALRARQFASGAGTRTEPDAIDVDTIGEIVEAAEGLVSAGFDKTTANPGDPATGPESPTAPTEPQPVPETIESIIWVPGMPVDVIGLPDADIELVEIEYRDRGETREPEVR